MDKEILPRFSWEIVIKSATISHFTHKYQNRRSDEIRDVFEDKHVNIMVTLFRRCGFTHILITMAVQSVTE